MPGEFMMITYFIILTCARNTRWKVMQVMHEIGWAERRVSIDVSTTPVGRQLLDWEAG
jgi:hypothetical protein